MVDEKKVKAAMARSESMTPEKRRDIAVKAAAARWGARSLKATHRGNFKAEFGIDVDCYVLDDEKKTAVISQSGMGAALGLTQRGNSLPRFVRGQRIAPYLGAELAEKLANPLVFQWATAAPSALNLTVNGYDVTILIDVCKAVVKSASAGKMAPDHPAVAQANVILSASAKAGIRDLVYALAGYEQTKEEVIAAFKVFIRDEAREYEKEFPDQLYKEWYRLYELSEPPRSKPWKFMHLTRDHVYFPLARSNGKILELTREQKAKSEQRRMKLHQFLSEIGVKALRTHLGQLLGIAQVSENKSEYEKFFQKVFAHQLKLDLGEEE